MVIIGLVVLTGMQEACWASSRSKPQLEPTLTSEPHSLIIKRCVIVPQVKATLKTVEVRKMSCAESPKSQHKRSGVYFATGLQEEEKGAVHERSSKVLEGLKKLNIQADQGTVFILHQEWKYAGDGRGAETSV